MRLENVAHTPTDNGDSSGASGSRSLVPWALANELMVCNVVIDHYSGYMLRIYMESIIMAKIVHV